jgi:hypothetical protein
MDPNHFDEISKRFARRSLSRRHTLRGLGAAGLAGALFALRREHAAADCPDFTRCEFDCLTCEELGPPDFPLPGGPAGGCWDWGLLSCVPCHTTSDALRASCSQADPACRGHCWPRFS